MIDRRGAGRRSQRWTTGWFATALTLLATAPLPAQSGNVREYQIKAAFLFHFAQFVDWPGNAFAGPAAPLCFGILGEDPFGAALDAATSGESIRGRPVIVRRSQRAADLAECHLVFVSRSERTRVADLLVELAPHPVLTVSEIEGFGSAGGSINFVLETNKVRFEINPTAARSRGLRISSELLSLGRLVDGGRNRGPS